jgi:hypothetical protein
MAFMVHLTFDLVPLLVSRSRFHSDPWPAGWLFGAGALTYSVELYGGLLVFAAYVIYDTQGKCRARVQGSVRLGSGLLQMSLQPADMCHTPILCIAPVPCACAAVIIEKAYAGQMDHVSHAMTLLVDLIGEY